MMELKVGTMVKANHPITVLNPDEWFAVNELKYSTSENKCWVRGENTCWFRADQVEVKE